MYIFSIFIFRSMHSIKNKKQQNFTQEISNNIPGMEIREEEEDEGF